MNYLDLKDSCGVAEDHMADLQEHAKVQRLLTQSQTLSLPAEQRGLLQWLSGLLQPKRRKRSMTPDADAQPRYRRRPA